MTDRYKIVVSPASDTDPPSNPFFTVDDLTGVNPPETATGMMATPYDYGATGTGEDDDTEAMQLWLTAIAGTAGYLRTGTFGISSTLTISGNTTIYGAGRGAAVIKKLDGFPSTSQLLLNKNQLSFPSNPVDANIAIYGVCFQGISSQAIPPAVALMQIIGVSSVTFRDCLFQNCRRSMIVFSNCSNVVLDGNEFSDWGSLEAVPSPGMCLFDGGAAILMYKNNNRVFLTNNYFHDGQWGGISIGEPLGCNQFNIAGNIFERVMEYGIFGNATSGIFSANTVNGVRLKDCSAQGFELGGQFYNIANNAFFDTDRASIYLTDAQVVNVTGNQCNTAGQSNEGATGGAGTITVLSSTTTGPNNITIEGNQIGGSDGLSPYGIALYAIGSGVPIRDLLIAGNNLGLDGDWRGAPMWVDDDAIGANFMIRANRGASAYDRSVSVVNVVIPAASTGTQAVGGVGFKASSIDFQANLASPSGSLSVSIGQVGWLTGWSIPGNAISSARAALQSSSVSWSTNGTAATSTARPGTLCINVIDSNGAPICQAALVEMTEDGFTLHIDSGVGYATVTAGGASYTANDTGLISGGDGLAAYKVLTVSGGAVATFEITNPGSGYTTTAAAATTTSGSQPGTGTGFTAHIYSSSPTTSDISVNAICHA